MATSILSRSLSDSAEPPPGEMVRRPPEAGDNQRLTGGIRLAGSTFALVGAAVGALVLVGWALRVAALKSVLPGLIAMNPMTAVAFIAVGVGLWLLREPAGPGTPHWAGRGLATLALLISGTRAWMGHWPALCWIDTLLFPTQVRAGKGPMAPLTCETFLLLSLAMLLLDVPLPIGWRRRRGDNRESAGRRGARVWPAQWLILAAGFSSLLAVTGYTYSLSTTGRAMAFRAMAIHTAGEFLLLSVAALLLRPRRGLMAIASSASPAGAMARRLLPAATVLPVVIGWVAVAGRSLGWYDDGVVAPALVATSAFVFTLLVWWNLLVLDRLDAYRRGAESGLAEAEAVYHSLVETLPQNIYRKDLAGHFTFANRNFCATLGRDRDRLVGKTDLDFFPESLAARYRNDDRQVIETGQTLDIVEEHVKPNGEKLYVQVMKTPVYGPEGDIAGTQGIFWDVTDRKLAEKELERKNLQLEEAARTERQVLDALRAAHDELKATQSHLVQSEKLAGLGQMVAGVAHEINNPLAFVINNVVVLQRDMKSLTDLLALYSRASGLLAQHDPALLAEINDLIERVDLNFTLENLSELLSRSREGLRRIQQIVKDLRDFARLDESDLHEVDLNAAIASTVNIIHGYARKRGVTIEVEPAPLPLVACFPAKINQVVMNLLSNAIDASPDGARVVVRTTPVAGASAKPTAVRIEVIDHGAGIPPEIRQRIFDPFFTTKPPGKGTGLGLSISYGIVQDHGGAIEVQSEVGKGTTFSFTLPTHCK